MHASRPAARLVLASGSAARAAMLRSAGLAPEQRRPVVDEESVREALRAEQVSGTDAAVALAELKAQQVARQEPHDAIVLGGDQILELDGEWLEKPADLAAARAQLLALRGRRHRLISAAVAFRGGVRVWHAVDAAELWVRPFGEAFLEDYLAACGEDVLGSVGAYQLEGRGAQLMSRVQGDYFTVLGMPLLPVLQFLRDQGVLAD
ncbi:Maf family protein [Marinimicrococcus flavescens]|uniref:Nucleoside triphosphate pyrophosphatase n=1 Tax=Marinimicrococcus flavescens TaxID=3031815 RepID=A0AAP3UZS8_9PROT|nr:Maf family protein [Marinimicrococcus flavescens]